jgi:ABC-type sugar transport system, permease component
MLAISFSGIDYVLKCKVTFIPKGFNLDMYKYVLGDKNILTGYKNTIIYVVVGTLISMIITTAAAFSLSKGRMIYHKFFTILLVITIYFGGGMIPTYLTVRSLGLYNTMWAVILPGAVSTYNLLIMRTFFDQFPVEIEESGKLDGLNDIQILWYLVLPVSGAVLASIALFYGVSIWNSFFTPFIYLQDSEKYPLQLILRAILLSGQSQEGSAASDVLVPEAIRYATIIVSVAPVIAVYPFLQKYFIKGVMLGSVKG